MKKIKMALLGLVAALALLAGGTAPAMASNDAYRIPQCSKGNGPGLKTWNGYSKQDGWNKWFYTKGGCTTAAVEHWGDVTGNQP